MPRMVLLRHGESLWNRDNRFTGWTDVDLSHRGLDEARQAAKLIARDGLEFDLCLTSVQKRAIRTLWIVLDELDLMYMHVERHWRLNERHYGALQGQDKDEKRREVGEDTISLDEAKRRARQKGMATKLELLGRTLDVVPHYIARVNWEYGDSGLTSITVKSRDDTDLPWMLDGRAHIILTEHGKPTRFSINGEDRLDESKPKRSYRLLLKRVERFYKPSGDDEE